MFMLANSFGQDVACLRGDESIVAAGRLTVVCVAGDLLSAGLAACGSSSQAIPVIQAGDAGAEFLLVAFIR
jgi:hypothetical protein